MECKSTHGPGPWPCASGVCFCTESGVGTTT
jgi:hypothetical protein